MNTLSGPRRTHLHDAHVVHVLGVLQHGHRGVRDDAPNDLQLRPQTDHRENLPNRARGK